MPEVEWRALKVTSGLPFLILALCAHTVLAQSATGPLPPLAPPAPPLPPTYWEQHGLAISAGGLGLTALVAAALWFILQKRPPAPTPADVLARETLTRLRGRPEDGRVLGEISRTLRRYLGAILGLPPRELTTTEFCAALTGHPQIGVELAQTAAGLLRDCDERKFAPPGPAAPLNAADRALAMVAAIEQQRAQLAAESEARNPVDG